MCVCVFVNVHSGTQGAGRDTFKPGVGERKAIEKEQSESRVPAGSSSSVSAITNREVSMWCFPFL